MPAMPEVPEFPSGQVARGQEREVLRAFSDAVEKLLGNLVDKASVDPADSFFLSDLVPLMHETWHEEMPGEFAGLRDRIPRIAEEELDRHGFRGRQLRFKLGVVRARVREFVAGGVGEALSRLLDSIDSVLDSLLGAAGVGTAIKEFKEALKNAIVGAGRL
jgi:hypothetical protein